MGFPTANISLHDYIDLEDGTYKMNIVVGEKAHSWMWTIMTDKNLCEAHIFDFTQDLYEQEIEVVLLKKIRDNIAFTSPDELIHQITQDMAHIKNISWKVLTFGTFDHLHPGHNSYLSQARKYGNQLISIVALDKTVEKIKWSAPDHNQHQRLEALQKLWLPDHIVVLWDPDNVYQCLHDRTPDVIFLWYDQHSFDEGILEYSRSHGLKEPIIIRGESYMPGVYKSSLMRG